MSRRGLFSRIGAAVSREVRASLARAFFAAAATNRLNKNLRAPQRLHPNTAVSADGATIRARLRQLGRDNPLVAGAKRSFKTGVLPTPILVEPDVRGAGRSTPSAAMNRVWNDPIAAKWAAWCAGPCDFFGWESHADTFGTIQSKAVQALFTDGECFLVTRRRTLRPGELPEFQVELMTSDRLDASRVMAGRGLAAFDGRRPGIEYDDRNRPVAYWFSTTAGGGISAEGERIPAADVIHVIVPNEPGEQVGEMTAASVLMPMQWLKESVESELSIRAIMSKIAGVITGGDDLGAEDSTDGNGNPFRQLDFEDGTLLQVSADSDFKPWDMNRPGAQWPALVETFLRWISAGLGIPYSVLAADFRGLNYSVSRMEQMAAQPFLELWRRDIVGVQLVARVYERFVRECVNQGIIAIPGTLSVEQLSAHRLRLPKTAYVDPLKDAQADLARIRMGESPQRVFGERGLDYYEELDALAEAKMYADELGLTHLTIFAPEPGSTTAAITKQIEKDEQEQSAAAALPEKAPAERTRRVA